MSRYDHESITLTLPAAAVAPLKAALREKTNSVFEQVKAEAVRLHKSFGTRSVKLYEERLRAVRWELTLERSALEDRYSGFGIMLIGNGRGPMVDPYEHRRIQRNREVEPLLIRSMAFEVLERVILAGAKPHEWEQREPIAIHQPTTADVNRVVKKLTNKDTVFDLFDYQGLIKIEGRTVRYESGDGNHAAESARNSILGLIFFAYLGKVTWTKGTGGVGTGNDEYNEDEGWDRNDYITGEWGPLGEARRQSERDFMLMQAGLDPRTGLPLR